MGELEEMRDRIRTLESKVADLEKKMEAYIDADRGKLAEIKRINSE